MTVLVAEPALAALKAVVQRGYVMQRGRIVDMRDDAASLDTAYKQSMGMLEATVEQ